MDRRKKYTQMVLKESFLKLLNEKNLSSITVKELCQLADINRSTFYSHYADQYDLLSKMEEEIIDDMTLYLNGCNLTKEDEAEQVTEKLMEYIVKNKEVCQTLLGGNGNAGFLQKVMAVAKENIKKSGSLENQLSEDIAEYWSTFIVSGGIYVIKNWLERGMDKTPKEMAGMINAFANSGFNMLKIH
ncbi:transcriptional regulator, TetR family [Gracilibacillus ureilyticus]|uniref:Transcriptional regulator, TetR family n=1 Tax=Gracilibacillus ureilyticus TaxID=531814 RepID=A0A1H9P855_9BACI|nr:TetR-like C-terminal domain-containing protein [Gracilibacillus ureilyticus]SER44398.1 transcriptional regulator, TetR family [Gracilibacillus ureilyticus]